MQQSAENVGLRERQTTERRETLARRARQLTIERGYDGFTIEELCESVGISRRTFFNYFPSKEEAVIGRPDHGLDSATIDAFVAGGTGRSVVEDLVLLGVRHLIAVGFSAEHATEMFEMITREPRLLAAMLQTDNERDRLLADIVSRREGIAATDPAALLAAQLAGTILRSAVFDAIRTGDVADLEERALARVAVAGSLLTARS